MSSVSTTGTNTEDTGRTADVRRMKNGNQECHEGNDVLNTAVPTDGSNKDRRTETSLDRES